MKRLRRIIFNWLAALSLVLSVAMVASWVRSYWRMDWIQYHFGDPGRTILTLVGRGHVGVSIMRVDRTIDRDDDQSRWEHFADSAFDMGQSDHSVMGIGWARTLDASRFRWQHNAIIIPHAYLLLVFAAFPAIRAFRWIRRRRLMLAGHCPVCGYDLRATPDCCPECGAMANESHLMKRMHMTKRP